MRRIAVAAAAAVVAMTSAVSADTLTPAGPMALSEAQMDGVTAGGIWQSVSQSMLAYNSQTNTAGNCLIACNVGNPQIAVTAGAQLQFVNQEATLIHRLRGRRY